jgi:DNA repair protein RecO (recombination protein O)
MRMQTRKERNISMGQTILLNGIVLSAMPIGDYDKRLIVLTKERGRVTVFARGARRPNSSLLAATNPFAFGEFELFEGKTSYNACKITVKNYFRELTEQIDTATYGFYFLELADYYGVENQEAKDMCNLLYISLRSLMKPEFDNRLVRRIFELRMLFLAGEYPNVFRCVSCGAKENLTTFHVRRGGMLCGGCGAVHGGIAVDASTLYTMQFVLSAPPEKLYSFQVSETVLSSLERILNDYMACYADRRFRSLELLDAL